MRRFEMGDLIAGFVATALGVFIVVITVFLFNSENRKQQYWDDCVAKKSPGECYNVQVMRD